MENSIEEDMKRLELCSTNQCNICGRYEKEECMLERNRCEQHILSAYQEVLKENEEWDRKFCNLQNLYFKLQDEFEAKRREYQETYKDVREELRELKKENEELKIIKSAIQTLQINSLEEEKYIVISKGSFLDGSYKHLLDDYIPIQKIKDKIERIQEEGYWLFTTDRDSDECVEVLQELLGGKEQNE